MSEFLRSNRKVHSSRLQFDALLSEGGLERGHAHSKILELGHQAGELRFVITEVADLILKGLHPLLQFTHFLRRSFASLGESRVALGARPATTLAPEIFPRNLKMETAMTGTRRLIPECAEVISAYRMVTHPEEFRDLPDLEERMRKAWQVLLADRRMRIDAKRAAAAIRSIFPEDAA